MSDADARIEGALKSLERRLMIRRILTLAGLLVIVGLTYLGLQFINLSLSDLQSQFNIWIDSLVRFTRPDFEDFTVYSIANGADGWSGLFRSFLNPLTFGESLAQQEGIVGRSLVTITIGFVGTVLGFPLALLFGVLGSERVTPFPFNFIFRGVMSTIRAIPAIIWILIYVPLAGISPVGATLAVATDTVGNLGRLFTDELEEISDGPIEAIGSTGASRSQVVTFGMLSQVSTSFIAWTLYILEINVRIAITLGVLGAGGLGQYVDGRIGLLEYEAAAAGIMMIIFIVLSVELLSSRIRARLRPGEHEGKGLVDSIRDLGDGSRWLGTGGSKD